MIRNQRRAADLSKRQLAGNHIATLIGSGLWAMMATGALAGETEPIDRDELDREVTREVTHNEDGSKTIARSGSLTNTETGETANFDSTRNVIGTESGREWTSEGTRTTFGGETLSSAGSGSVSKGEDNLAKSRTRTVTNETTGDARTRSSDLSLTRIDEGVHVVGTRSRTGPDGGTVTRAIDRVRPTRPDRPALARPDRPARPPRIVRRARREN